MPNDWWGVPGGQVVEITFVYLSRVYDFEDALPDDTRDQAVSEVQDPRVLVQDGEFKGFPHYPTTGADINARQSNLLANMAGYVIMRNEEIFRNALM